MITETDRQLRTISSELKRINNNLERLCKILSLKDKEADDEDCVPES